MTPSGSGRFRELARSRDQRLDHSARDISYAIGVGRMVWGAVAACVPGRAHRILGVPYPGDDFGVWVRAFGVRDIVLGLAALHPDPVVRRANLRAGIVMDLADVGVVAVAYRRGLPRRAAALGVILGGGTAMLALAGPSLLRTLREDEQRRTQDGAARHAAV